MTKMDEAHASFVKSGKDFINTTNRNSQQWHQEFKTNPKANGIRGKFQEKMEEMNDPKKAKENLAKVFLGLLSLYVVKMVWNGITGRKR